MRGGIDLGGTKIQAIVVDDDSNVLGQTRLPTPDSGGPPAVIGALADALTTAAQGAGSTPHELTGVGVGSPGSIDTRSGIVANASNLPDWDAPFPMADALAELLDTKVKIGNDVDVGVDAEYALGAARGSKSVLGVFWGTGVGGGLILNGRRWTGRGHAGEIGHVVVKQGGARCPCGRKGCMEAYAGRGAMEEKARELVAEGQSTKLFRIMEKRGRTRLQSGIWDRALQQDDAMAKHLVDRAVKALGTGVASVVNVLDIETVVIGGGLGTRLGEPYVRKIAKAMKPHLFVDDDPPKVVGAELGDLGGALGAALLVKPRARAGTKTTA